jgi:hypothetical protein
VLVRVNRPGGQVSYSGVEITKTKSTLKSSVSKNGPPVSVVNIMKRDAILT